MPSPRLAQLEKLLALDPADAFVLYGIAQEHAKDGAAGHERAIPFYDRCLAADAAYCYAYYHKAVSLIALGRVDEARQTLTAGQAAAKTAGDTKALGELTALAQTL